MKKILSFVLGIFFMLPCLVLFSSCKQEETTPAPTVDVWDGTAIEVSADENGVVYIDSAEEFAGFARSVNKGNTYIDKVVELTIDLDLNFNEWTPIGYGSYDNNANQINFGAYFDGIFDGKNHKISNLKLTNFKGGSANENSATGVGLFGQTLGTIKNVIVENAEIKGNHYVAVISGFNAGATIENCHVYNAEVNCVYMDKNESGAKAGIIAGFMCSNFDLSYLTNCSGHYSKVTASCDAGQILGGVTVENQNNITGNVDDEILVLDNNEIQNTTNFDNIKNEHVGVIS